MMTRPAAEWEMYLNEKSVPAMQVLSLPEAINQPQVKARNFMHTFEAADGVAKFTVPTEPYRLSGSAAPTRKRAPKLGEHTDVILLGIGMSK